MKFKFTLAFLLMLMCSFGLQLSAQDACDDLEIVIVNGEVDCDEDTGLSTLTLFILGGSGNYEVSLNGASSTTTSGSYTIEENTGGSVFDVDLLVTDEDTGCTLDFDYVLPICAKLCDGEAGELTGVAPGGSYCSGQPVEVGATGTSVATGTFAQTFILVSGDDIVAVAEDGNFGTLADGSYCIYQYSYVFNNALPGGDNGVIADDYTSFADFADAVQLATVCSDLGDEDGNCTPIEVSSASLVVTPSVPVCDEATNITSINFIVSGGSGDYEYSENGGSSYDTAPGVSIDLEFNAGDTISFIVRDNITGCTSTPINQGFGDCVKACDAVAGVVDGPTAFCEGDDVAGYSATGVDNFPNSFDLTYAAFDGDGMVVATDENGNFGALAAGTYCIHSIRYVIVVGNPVELGITIPELETADCISVSEDCFSVEVTAAPVADPAGPADSVCDGTDFTLSAGDGFDSYAWTGPDGFESDAQNPTASATGTYTLVVTLNGCSSAPVDVEVTGGGTLDFSIVEGPATICSGGSTTFTSSVDDSNYTYLWTTDGGTVDTPNESSTSYTMGMPGTYTVSLVVTDGSGCTAEAATVEVTVVEATDVPDPDDITICPGTTTDIAGPDGYAAYSWDSGEDTQALTVGAGTYVLTLTDDNGCTDDVTYTVVEGDGLDLPDPDPVSICEGSETTISAPAGYASYSWDSGEDTQDITVGAGTYVVTVSDGAGCSDDVTYVVNDDLVITIDTPEPVSICPGSETTISGPDGYASYSWDSGEDTQEITVGVGSYELTVTDENGCSASATYVVEEGDGIELTDPDPVSICEGAETAISGPDGYESYSWDTGEDTQEITVGAGSYVVTVTDENGCSGSATYVVNDDLTITLDTPDPVAVCPGSEAIISGPDGYASYSWDSGEDTQEITVGVGSYELTVTDENGCSASTTYVVEEVAGVELTDPDPVSVCPGSEVTLTAPGGFKSYLWDSGQNTQDITVGPGTYVVTVMDDDGCIGSATYVVEEGEGIELTDPDPVSVCVGAEAAITGPTGYTSYSWDTGEETQTIAVGAGSYVVTVTDENGCSGSATYVVNEDLVITIDALEPATICPGSTTAISGPDGYESYSWDSGENTQEITVGAGAYELTVTDASGCSASATYVVNEGAGLDLPNPEPIAVCSGSDATLTAPSGYSYLWADGSTDQAITVSAAGNYLVTVSDGAGCSDELTFAVSVIDTPTEPAPEPVEICSGESATLTAPAGYTYSWSNGSGEQSITVNQTGTYTVTIANGNCTQALDYVVSVGDAPNEAQPDAVTICEAGGSATLTGPAGYTYLWYNGSSDASVTVTGSGSYDLTISSGSCSQTLTYTVGIGGINEADPDPVSICAGSSTTLAAPAGYTYSWSNGSVAQTITAIAAGTYTVTLTAGDCSLSLDYDVTETQPTALSISGNAADACPGTAITFTASGATNYSWTATGGTLSSTTGGSVTLTAGSNAGTYSVNVTSTDACTTDGSITYNVLDGSVVPCVDPIDPSSIGGVVFDDLNGNGVQDPGEPGIPGVTVTITGPDGTTITTVTNNDGMYTFPDLDPGTYTVTVGPGPEGTSLTTSGTITITVGEGEDVNTGDFGYQEDGPDTGSIGGIVFDDLNGNGVQDPGEPGIGGVTVTATDANGNTVTVVSNADGSYSFPGLAPGTYTVTVGAGPAGTTLTTSGSNTVTVVAGVNSNGGAFGFNNNQDNSIGDTVFDDLNNNGVQDPGEPGIPGVTVTLFDANGNNIGSTVTNANGIYTFPNLADGTYTVSVTVPGNGTLTTAGSFTVTVSGGQSYVDADFGINTIRPCTVDSGTLTLTSSAGGAICGNGAITVEANGFTTGADYSHIYVLTDENDIIVATSVATGVFSGIAPGIYTVYSFSYATSIGTPTVGQDFFASYLSNSAICWDVSDGIPLSVAQTIDPVISLGTGNGPDAQCNEDEASWDGIISFPGAGPITLTGDVTGSFSADQVIAFTIPENTTYSMTATDASGCSQSVTIAAGSCSKSSVELVDFDGRAENAGNYIFWSTASEVESKVFRVESSTNGTDFTAIATVNAAGNSNVLNSYDILDNNAAAGNTYYRLVEVDIYGTETTYNTISVYRESDVRTTITVAPVPVQNVLNIQLTNENPIDAQLQVFDMSGKVVKVVSNVNTNSITIDVVDLAAGTYFVVLTTADESTTTKFIKD